MNRIRTRRPPGQIERHIEVPIKSPADFVAHVGIAYNTATDEREGGWGARISQVVRLSWPGLSIQVDQSSVTITTAAPGAEKEAK
jgi:hypothetical protein